MSLLKVIRLKKNEDRRVRAGHLWVYSNEINTTLTPFKSLKSGEEVLIESHEGKVLGVGYINPHSLITVRLFSTNPNDRLDLDFFIRKMTTARTMRDQLYSHPYYRLVFGESDGLPGLIIDRFNQDLVVQINTAGMECQKDTIVSALRHVLPETESLLFRNDSSARAQEGLEKSVLEGFGTLPSHFSILENDTHFIAPVLVGQKTGWFYDHRLNRSRLKDYAKNQTVLDVFSYLGAWGIQAALHGAVNVTCIDASALSATWIPKNAALNGVQDIVSVITEDAFFALKKLASEGKQFSLIILDPPAFIKKQKDKKEGFLAYQRINELALKLLAPYGTLISCSCSMHLPFDELIQAIRRASLRCGLSLQILERGHQASDHPLHLAIPETDYLKMVIARRVT